MSVYDPAQYVKLKLHTHIHASLSDSWLRELHLGDRSFLRAFGSVHTVITNCRNRWLWVITGKCFPLKLYSEVFNTISKIPQIQWMSHIPNFLRMGYLLSTFWYWTKMVVSVFPTIHLLPISPFWGRSSPARASASCSVLGYGTGMSTTSVVPGMWHCTITLGMLLFLYCAATTGMLSPYYRGILSWT